MSPVDIQDFLERAKNAAQIGEYEEAERLLKNYFTQTPVSREARILMGTILTKMERFDEAVDEFIVLVVDNPSDLEALNNLAVVYRQQGKYQEALNTLIEAIDLDSTRAELHYNLGNVHKQLGNNKAAAMAYAKVLELDPSYVPAYNNLGTVYVLLNEYDKAINILTKGLTIDQNNPTLLFNYGLALDTKGSLEEAIRQYQLSLKSKPGWIKCMNHLGIAYLKQGEDKKADVIFSRLLDLEPSNADVYCNIGTVHANQGRTKDAIQNFRKALELNPDDAKAAINLGKVFEDQQDWKNAANELLKVIRLSPENTDVRNRLARVFLNMENYPKALGQAMAVLGINSNDIDALRVFGSIKKVSRNDKEADEAFAKINEQDSGNYIYLLDTADIYYRRKKYRMAEEQLLAYLVHHPHDRNAMMFLGRVYAEMNERAKALDIFEELTQIDPNDTEALSIIAELQKEKGSLEQALRTADTLINVQGQRASSDDLSDLNKSLEFYESAVDAYSNIVFVEDETEPEEESIEEDDSMLFSPDMIPLDETEGDELLSEEDIMAEELLPEEDVFDLIMTEEPSANPMGGSPASAVPKDNLDKLADIDNSDIEDFMFEESSVMPASSLPDASLTEPEALPSQEPAAMPADYTPAAAPAPTVVVAPIPMPIQQQESPPMEIKLSPIEISVKEIPQVPPRTETPKAQPASAASRIVVSIPKDQPLKEAEADKEEMPSCLDLMKHLKDLAGYLPEEIQQEYIESETQSSMDNIIGILESFSGK